MKSSFQSLYNRGSILIPEPQGKLRQLKNPKPLFIPETYRSKDRHLADRLRGVVRLSTEPQTAVAAFFDVLVVLEDQSNLVSTFLRQSERSS